MPALACICKTKPKPGSHVQLVPPLYNSIWCLTHPAPPSGGYPNPVPHAPSTTIRRFPRPGASRTIYHLQAANRQNRRSRHTLRHRAHGLLNGASRTLHTSTTNRQNQSSTLLGKEHMGSNHALATRAATGQGSMASTMQTSLKTYRARVTRPHFVPIMQPGIGTACQHETGVSTFDCFVCPTGYAV